ncbi:MAG: radical SAM protein, partial [Rhodospirillaceae bacterium]
AAKVLSLVRQMRGGALYDSRFGDRMSGQGPLAQLLARRFAVATHRLGLRSVRWSLRTDLFTRPARAGDQLGLF